MNSEEQAFESIHSSESFEEDMLAWLRMDPNPASTPSFPVPDALAENAGKNSGVNSGVNSEKRVEAERGSSDSPAEALYDSRPVEEAVEEEVEQAFDQADFIPKTARKTNPNLEGNDSEILSPESLRSEAKWKDNFSGFAKSESQQDRKLRPGEIPVVQERFNALLKRRLKSEIQQHPPLFPWESDRVFEYQAETNDFPQVQEVPALDLWLPQLQQIGLPVAVPEMVLARLLEQCNEVIKSSLRQGQKLVRAVEALFPGRERELNQLAGLAIASPTRGAIASAPRGTSNEATSNLCTLGSEFPSSYESATQTQQMVLSLLAVREALGTLTLRVSSDKPHLERQWLTSAGPLNIEIERQQLAPELRVRAKLPSAGSLQLSGVKTQGWCDRPNPGLLSVELFDPQEDQTYFLEIRLQNEEHNPLIFAISCAEKEI